MAIFTENYRAMSSPFAVRVDLPHADANAKMRVRQLFSRLQQATETIEQCLSRFRADSELSSVNSHVGEVTRVSLLFASVLKKADEAYQLSAGLFDPRVIQVLQDIGYPGVRNSNLDRTQSDPTEHAMGDQFVIWHADDVIELTAPIDLGGIGKGYTVDFLAKQVLQTFAAEEMSGFLVNAGGDVVLHGRQENGEPWTVGVENPFSPKEIFAALTCADQTVAICTSSKWRRKWLYQGQEMHHLIDPRTGSPARTDVMSVTALAPEAAIAEVMTKMVFLEGECRSEFVNSSQVLMINERRELLYTPALVDYLAWVTPEASRVQQLM